MTTRSCPAAGLLALLLLVSPMTAQRLTLSEVFRRAESQAWANQISQAQVTVATARADGALRGLLPTVRAEAGWLRSNDPLAAFGVTMRQRGVTPEAFDPSRLNQPDPKSDLSTGLVLELPLLNLDARAGRRALLHAADAAAAQSEWQATGLQLDLIRVYYGTVLARAQVVTLLTAQRAAQSHVSQAQSAARNGMVTQSDALLAQVRAGELATQLAKARGDAAVARLQLALLLGEPGDTLAPLPDFLPLLPVSITDPEGIRADLRSAAAVVDAADAGVTAAGAALLPRINSFARYDWHAAGTPFGGTPMWTMGVMASWNPFSGGAELAQQRVARAEAAAARSGAQAATAMATLEVQEAGIAVNVARQALAIASSSVAQATEAHRVVSLKYQGGLATITELLDVQTAEITTRLAEANARYDLLTSQAVLTRARGSTLTNLAAALDAALPE